MWAKAQVQFPKLHCFCGSSVELTSYFLLHYPIFNYERHAFLSSLKNIDSKILVLIDSYLIKILFYDSITFFWLTNTLFLTQLLTIFYPLNIRRKFFSGKKSLFFICNSLIYLEFSLVYQIYLYLHFIILSSIYLIIYLFICTPSHPRFSVAGGCDCISIFMQKEKMI